MPARSGYLLPDHLSTLELREKRGIALRQLAVNAEAHVGPAADPLAVVQVRMHGRAVARVRLVVAAARTQRPRPADAAVGLVRDVMPLQEHALHIAIDAVADRPEFVGVRAGEPVAERDIAVGRDTKQPEARAARKRFADAFVQLFHRLLDVREAVMAVRDGVLEELVRQLAE